MQFLGVVLCLVIFDAHAAGSRKPTNPKPPVASPIPVSGGVTLVCDSTCTDKERLKVAQAQEHINFLRNSQCVVDYLLKRKLTYTNNMTNDEILIDLGTREVKATVTFYQKNNNTIGYRNKGSSIVHFNRKFHDKYDSCFTTSNAWHEVAHVMGYTHPSSKSTARSNSLPYQLNRAVEKCCK